MTTKPKTRKAPAKIVVIDPIFAAIDAYKARTKEMSCLYDKLEEAEFEAAKTYGRRLWPLIGWRNYSEIGGREIDDRRKEFLSQPGADPKQVEKEFRNAKAREAAAEQAGVEWDQRAGIAPLREQYERARLAEHRGGMRMARTKPTTMAGAAAMITYTRRDIMKGEVDWQMVALKTVAVALAQMNVQAA